MSWISKAKKHSAPLQNKLKHLFLIIPFSAGWLVLQKTLVQLTKNPPQVLLIQLSWAYWSFKISEVSTTLDLQLSNATVGENKLVRRATGWLCLCHTGCWDDAVSYILILAREKLGWRSNSYYYLHSSLQKIKHPVPGQKDSVRYYCKEQVMRRLVQTCMLLNHRSRTAISESTGFTHWCLRKTWRTNHDCDQSLLFPYETWTLWSIAVACTVMTYQKWF